MKTKDLDLLANTVLNKLSAVSATDIQAGAGQIPGQPPAAPPGMPPGMPMDPAAMGGMPPGAPMDPAAMGGMPMDPAAMGAPPGPDPLTMLADMQGLLAEHHKMLKQIRTIVSTMAQTMDVKIALNELLDDNEEDPIAANAAPGAEPAKKESRSAEPDIWEDIYEGYEGDPDGGASYVTDVEQPITSQAKTAVASEKFASAMSLITRKLSNG